jgi:tetratricopeptide (TPR) repeat protein
MAEALDPNLPGLKFDLATAYFELAESDRANILDYTYAIDYFMQYLQQVHQSDPTALFDLGLCWERRSVVSEAIKNFEAALALEHDPAWRAEIQSHLNKLKALTALDLSPEQLEATLTPQHFLTLTTEAPGQYELYLDAATRKWLPNRQTALVTSTASAAVEKSVPLKGTASAVPQNSLRASGALVSA